MAKLIPTAHGYKCDVHINKHRIRQFLSSDRAKAKRMLKEMIEAGRAKRRGGIVSEMSWDYFKEEHLRHSKINLNRKTYGINRRAFELYDSVIHINRLEDMTPARLIEGQNRLKEKGERPTRSTRAIITAMRRAEDLKYVQIQNWRIVKYDITEGRMDFYEEENYFDLISRLSGVFKTFAWIAGRAGLRPSEAIYLEWPEIQFQNNRIIFRSKLHLGFRIKGDKKLQKVRVIPMYQDLRDYLLSIRKASGFVLDLPCARRTDSFGKLMTKVLRGISVKTYEGTQPIPYTLRHTFASHLAQHGASDRFIAELLGHEDTSMVGIYSHLRPVDLQRIVKKGVSTLCPPLNSEGLATPLLTHSSDNLVNGNLSSEIHRNA